MFRITATTLSMAGVLVSWREKKTRINIGIKLLAVMPKQKSPRHAAVNLVSRQSNWPLPKTSRTAWALKRSIRSDIGTTKKTIFLQDEEKLSKNSFFWPLARNLEKTGKEETAKGMPIRPIGKY